MMHCTNTKIFNRITTFHGGIQGAIYRYRANPLRRVPMLEYVYSKDSATMGYTMHDNHFMWVDVRPPNEWINEDLYTEVRKFENFTITLWYN